MREYSGLGVIVGVAFVVSIMSSPASATQGWTATTGGIQGSPVFADLDGDGVAEVVAANQNGTLHVFDIDGAPLSGWPAAISSGTIFNPAVVDLDGDGSPEIALTANEDVWVLDAAGNVLPGWPVLLPFQNSLTSSGPVIVDVDADGSPDVGVTNALGVFFFDRFGAAIPGWPYLWDGFNNSQFGAPAVGDLDGDGSIEIVAAATAQDLHVIRGDGTPFPGWPQPIDGTRTSPALADLDSNGDLEIVVQDGQGISVWNHDGTGFPGWPQPVPFTPANKTSPAIADVDGDGELDVVAIGGHIDGQLFVFDSDGSLFPGFPFGVGGVSDGHPVVVDIDDDDQAEIFLKYKNGGGPLLLSGWRIDGTILLGFPTVLNQSSDLVAVGSLHVADADSDGMLELVAATTKSNPGVVHLIPIATSITGGTLQWPKNRRDLANTGSLGESTPPKVPSVAFVGLMLLVVLIMLASARAIRRRGEVAGL